MGLPFLVAPARSDKPQRGQTGPSGQRCDSNHWRAASSVAKRSNSSSREIPRRYALPGACFMREVYLAATLVKSCRVTPQGSVQTVLRRSPSRRHPEAHGPRKAPELPDAQTSALRKAGGTLRRVPRGLPVQELHGRPRGATEPRRIGPLRKLATFVRGVQLCEGRPAPRGATRYAQREGDSMKHERTIKKKPRRRKADPPVPYPRPPSPEALARALRRKPAKRSA